MKNFIMRLVKDVSGVTAVEYALLAAGAAGVLTAVGNNFYDNIKQTLEGSVARGDLKFNRGLIWARRLLDDRWQFEMGFHQDIQNDPQKIILVILGSSPQLSAEETSDLIDSCSKLADEGIRLTLINWSEDNSWPDLLSACLSDGHYKHVQTVAEYNSALADFFKTLLEIRVVALNLNRIISPVFRHNEVAGKFPNDFVLSI
ncbi:Flp family type IVb pilin [Sneathiella limimaris]|uniref:Flp family type IVb pilin n=1 Tax=Sneathiella limimaris TaxID=1964213 RepID=UPI001469FF08|nr:Flp family type IVb pilin [Sneathiella limimaris]